MAGTFRPNRRKTFSGAESLYDTKEDKTVSVRGRFVSRNDWLSRLIAAHNLTMHNDGAFRNARENNFAALGWRVRHLQIHFDFLPQGYPPRTEKRDDCIHIEATFH